MKLKGLRHSSILTQSKLYRRLTGLHCRRLASTVLDELWLVHWIPYGNSGSNDSRIYVVAIVGAVYHRKKCAFCHQMSLASSRIKWLMGQRQS